MARDRTFVKVVCVIALLLAALRAAAEDDVASREHWVDRDGFRLYVWEKFVGSPEGKPVVVLAHGSGTAGRESFDLQMPGDYSLMDLLARAGYDVFAPDVHGFGRSARPEGHVTTDAAAADLAAVVAAVRACRGRQKIGMVAWSWGTQYAGLFVMAHPDAVSRYVSYAQMHVGSADLARGRARLDFYRSHAWTVVPREGWKARFRSGTPDDVTDPAVMERFADAAAAVETRTSTGPQLDMVTRLPLVDPARIAVPTLMIHGEYDDVADAGGLLPFFAALPNPEKRYVIVPRAGHLMHLQAGRTVFARAVIDFLGAARE